MPRCPTTNYPRSLRNKRPRSDAALALEFLILTAARSGEVKGAHWSEIDVASKVWSIPAERMKAGRSHSVPLSPRAVEILEIGGKGEDVTVRLSGPGAQASLSRQWPSICFCAGWERK